MNIQTFISKQARERAKKDKFIQNNKGRYTKEIDMIRFSEGKRPTEIIGKFFISPRGNNPIRIAWHKEFNSKTNTLNLFVDDLLYHITEDKYVDKWNIKAATGEINLDSYSGYSLWVGF